MIISRPPAPRLRQVSSSCSPRLLLRRLCARRRQISQLLPEPRLVRGVPPLGPLESLAHEHGPPLLLRLAHRLLVPRERVCDRPLRGRDVGLHGEGVRRHLALLLRDLGPLVRDVLVAPRAHGSRHVRVLLQRDLGLDGGDRPRDLPLQARGAGVAAGRQRVLRRLQGLLRVVQHLGLGGRLQGLGQRPLIALLLEHLRRRQRRAGRGVGVLHLHQVRAGELEVHRRLALGVPQPGVEVRRGACRGDRIVEVLLEDVRVSQRRRRGRRAGLRGPGRLEQREGLRRRLDGLRRAARLELRLGDHQQPGGPDRVRAGPPEELRGLLDHGLGRLSLLQPAAALLKDLRWVRHAHGMRAGQNAMPSGPPVLQAWTAA
mmetsp:Transcript_43359/g.114699  ORF Transcript_43359/g.114699 Transcript_43359/m.114699 type:complete len:373 (+) Transcript_43359:2-1120(+)